MINPTNSYLVYGVLDSDVEMLFNMTKIINPRDFRENKECQCLELPAIPETENYFAYICTSSIHLLFLPLGIMKGLRLFE